MPTIRDVAKRARVAPSTVSGVLQGKTRVSRQTYDRVMAVVRSLGYRPNGVARGLRLGTTKTIGLIIPSILNPFYPGFARGVEDAAHERGYSVFICNSDRDVEKEHAYLAALRDRGVDGFIFAAPMVSPQDIAKLADAGKSVVAVSVAVPHRLVDEIWVDERSGPREAARLLARLGHFRIAYVGGPPKLRRARERYTGFREGLDLVGLRLPLQYVRHGRFDFESGYEATKELSSRRPRPTAIFFANDMMALGGIGCAVDAGMHVPQDLSIVGFDDIPFARYIRPTLTTVHQPSYEVGALAARWLIERKSDRASLRKRRASLPATLVSRDSIGEGPLKTRLDAGDGSG